MGDSEKKFVMIKVSPEFVDILEKIKTNISEYSWNVKVNVSNYEASQILVRKIKDAGLY